MLAVADSLLETRQGLEKTFIREQAALASSQELATESRALMSALISWHQSLTTSVAVCELGGSASSVGMKINLKVDFNRAKNSWQLFVGYKDISQEAYVYLPLHLNADPFLIRQIDMHLATLLLDGFSPSADLIKSEDPNLINLQAILQPYFAESQSNPQQVTKIARQDLPDKLSIRCLPKTHNLLAPNFYCLDSNIGCEARSVLSASLAKSKTGVFIKPANNAYCSRKLAKVVLLENCLEIKELKDLQRIKGLVRVETCDRDLAQKMSKLWPDRGIPQITDCQNSNSSTPSQTSWSIRVRLNELSSKFTEIFGVEPFIVEDCIDTLSYKRPNYLVDRMPDAKFKSEFRLLYCWSQDRSDFALQAGWVYESPANILHKYSPLGASNSSSIKNSLDSLAREVKDRFGIDLDRQELLTDLIRDTASFVKVYLENIKSKDGFPDCPIAIDLVPAWHNGKVRFYLVEVNHGIEDLKIGCTALTGAHALRLVFSDHKRFLTLPSVSSLVDVEDY